MTSFSESINAKFPSHGFFTPACEDALQLVHLCAERESPKYEKAALRWLERYLFAEEPTLERFAAVVYKLEPAPDPGKTLACSCTEVPAAEGVPFDTLVVAAWLRRHLSEGQELCVHEGGVVSFASKPGRRSLRRGGLFDARPGAEA